MKMSSDKRYRSDIFNVKEDAKDNNVHKTNQTILKLLTFQSFFLVNNIGRNIILETNDKEDLDFFFKIYQYIIFDMIKFLELPIRKKINPNSNIKNLKKKEMQVLYNYMIDFVLSKKQVYNQLEISK